MEYKVVLEAFEGPLALLMHLIEKEKVDIYDIPIAKITDQYIEYIKTMENIDLNMTSEFLVMAATLLEIKSKMLLPSSGKDDEQLEIDEIDPREELVRRLLEYKKYKAIADELKAKGDIQNRVFFKPKEELEEFMEQGDFELENVDFKELFLAYINVLNRSKDEKKEINLTEIQRDELTIEDCMDNLEKLIKEKEKIMFEELFYNDISRIEVVIMFLAILELIKLKEIKVIQEQNFGDIIIKKNINNLR
ncbi:MAG: segregation/condensation protein A [Tissierellales bacterium]